MGLWVPPSNVTTDGSFAPSMSGKRIVWNTRVVLPAPPIEKV
jgi:hypothetical protein